MVLVLLIVVFVLLFVLRYLKFGAIGGVEGMPETPGRKTLVVYGPPLGGRTSRPGLEKLVREAYPDADILVPTYWHRWMSNVDAFELTSQIETAIREADDRNKIGGAHQYEKIVLFGYSTGGLLLRKAYLWGHGLDDDRSVRHERHPWVERLDRLVSLSAPNRGWPSDKPEHLDIFRYVIAYVLQRFGRLTGTGRFIESLVQGSPFVSNMRVQWIDLFRDGAAALGDRKPLIIHLVGDKDELVDRDDSIDLEAGTGANVMIKTLERLTHAEISENLYRDNASALNPTGEAIRMALVTQPGAFPAYWADRVGALQTDDQITQLIFIMHGIRDEGTWPAEVKRSIEAQIGDAAAHVKIIPPLYRRFAMLPFLLYWDRQHNVRWFMDQYTQARAMYPKLEHVDFIGHSNGTYILASALQRYPVLKVRNIFFAGSVVPVHYDWAGRIADKQVTGRIWNVCADFDWVVAIFPQFFQQISDWLGIEKSRPGLLDIGSAGFRGFRENVATAGILRNLKYISGDHGAAFEPAMVDPIATYVSQNPAIDFVARWRPQDRPEPRGLERASNLSWLIWGGGLVGIVVIGAIFLHLAGWLGLLGFVVVLLGLLTTF
ncbi:MULTISPECIES: hypothetical protein [Bradyrhizobium]|jgi:pimeloyl-ACP methyl ester carboxylesterase|uniref:hypothetical protein n=1 Tax=Bradyrhizobium TaxID=374 RepID=UPI000231C379|nr:hypothetical protein [Bradyrhizobium japonicum]AJA59147.1 hypothetical protein RN69_00895 [Bradyrhizobium japonicum]KMJ96331.1 hypothetical protein CF64_27635 [Bradyrhizobium japonicum]MBR0765536.1 hypothetical protein [Bradyrhizobium japonicum]MCS3536227.1 pimeloyl-ACP methyl ester carboxylesterase [Bradyrhizobium japonicum]MCS3987672.1 pimeloyl-ACP methyl ester carboxylesterase [Bradyrhizobium japonicum]